MHKPESVGQHYTALMLPISNWRFGTAVNGMCDKYISRHRHFGCGNLVRIRWIVNVVYFLSKRPVLAGLSGVIEPVSVDLKRMLMMLQTVSINRFECLLSANGILITTGENPFYGFVNATWDGLVFQSSQFFQDSSRFQFVRTLTVIQLHVRKTVFLWKGSGTVDAEW